MKITLRDLDNNILEKLNALDNVAKTYDENHPDGFVSYGANGFYFKKTNDTFLKKVFDESEIVDLENKLYSKDKNILSSVYEDFRADNKFNEATKSFLFNIKFSYEKELESKIIKYKSFNNIIFTLNENGSIYKISDKNVSEYKVLDNLKNNFNLVRKIFVRDIVDFEIVDENTLILATSNFGVFKFSLSNNESELLFTCERVRKIKLTYTKNIFVLSDDFCAQYDITNGSRIEKYSNIYNRHQIPVDICVTDGDIFVLGAPVGISNLDNILHLWKLDEGKVSYNNYDSKIEKITLDKRYQVMFISYDTNFVYLSGLYNNKVFVLSVNKKDLSVNKKVIYPLEIDNYTDFHAIDGKFCVLSEDLLYILDGDEVSEKIHLERKCTRLKIFNGEIVSTSEKSIVKFQLNKFSKTNDTLSYSILNNEEPCNNIDILIKNAGRSERVTLIDGDTNREIPTSYYILYKGNAVLKLMNCKSTKIILKLSVLPTSKIGGIVVKQNKMFLR